MPHIERIASITNDLGEGPLWDHQSKSLFWVDSLKGKILRLSADDIIHSYDLPTMIGSLAIVDNDRAIVALQTGLYLFSFTQGTLQPICDPEAEQNETRFNDGKTDRQGSFLVGSMGIKVRDRALASLYRVNANLDIEILEDNVIVANGPCFSPDGSVLYFNDGRRRILAYDYSPNGPLKNKRIFFDGRKHHTSSDGATVDRDGNLWVALTGSSEVGCITPEGQLVERILMPVKLPSSVMFGGAHLDELYVTSIRNSGNRISDETGAGGLFRITNLGVIGVPEQRFNLAEGR